MDQSTATELIAGLDMETLTAISMFGDKYIHFLYWKDIVMPYGGILFFLICVFLLIRHGINKSKEAKIETAVALEKLKQEETRLHEEFNKEKGGNE